MSTSTSVSLCKRPLATDATAQNERENFSTHSCARRQENREFGKAIGLTPTSVSVNTIVQ